MFHSVMTAKMSVATSVSFLFWAIHINTENSVFILKITFKHCMSQPKPQYNLVLNISVLIGLSLILCGCRSKSLLI